MQKLTVELGDQRDYPIYIGTDLFIDASYLKSHIQVRQVCILTNETIAPLYLDKIKSLFQIAIR
jgi:3-dehydroquinate synthase